jgi:hypothetical protein
LCLDVYRRACAGGIGSPSVQVTQRHCLGDSVESEKEETRIFSRTFFEMTLSGESSKFCSLLHLLIPPDYLEEARPGKGGHGAAVNHQEEQAEGERVEDTLSRIGQ